MAYAKDKKSANKKSDVREKTEKESTKKSNVKDSEKKTSIKSNTKSSAKKSSEVKKASTSKTKKDTNVSVKESTSKEEKVVVNNKSTKKNNLNGSHIGDVILIVCAIVLVIAGFLLTSGKEGLGKLVEVSYSEYEELMMSGEPFAFIVESATCSHCVNYMPIVRNYTRRNNVTIYYIDLNNISEDDYNSLLESNSFFIDNADNWGTPTTMIVTGNNVSDSLVGETTYENLDEFLIKNNIKE